MAQAVFYLLAGPNGAGKSTLFRAAVAEGLIPAEAEFVNADLFEAAHLQHIDNPQLRSEQAREWADGRRVALLEAGQSFVSETVFFHESKLALIEHAQRCGFAVVLLVVCLDWPCFMTPAAPAMRPIRSIHPCAWRCAGDRQRNVW